jgi:hypothetical protein
MTALNKIFWSHQKFSGARFSIHFFPLPRFFMKNLLKDEEISHAEMKENYCSRFIEKKRKRRGSSKTGKKTKSQHEKSSLFDEISN